VDLSGGFNLSPSVQARLRLLDWIADNGGAGPRRHVDLAPLFENQDQDGAETVAGHLDALEDDGLICLQRKLARAASRSSERRAELDKCHLVTGHGRGVDVPAVRHLAPPDHSELGGRRVPILLAGATGKARRAHPRR